MRITYIGHATLLIRIGRQALLTDPNYEKSLGRLTIGSRLKRVAPPGLSLDELPPIDAVLLSHAHADHLSFRTLRDVADRNPQMPVVCPPSVARWLEQKKMRQVAALDPGASLSLGSTTVHCSAATHEGSRYGVDRWRGHANMYLAQCGDLSCFFAGDTALTPGTHQLVADEVHAHDRTLDVALLPIGHAPRWKRSSFRKGHLTTEDALELFARLKARWMVPYHWGTFNHLTSGAHDAIEILRADLERHAAKGKVRILEPGEMLDVRGASSVSRHA